MADQQRVFISRPGSPDYADIDSRVIARLHMMGFTHDGSGGGGGQRGLDFTSRDNIVLLPIDHAAWDDLRREIAKLSACLPEEVQIMVRQQEREVIEPSADYLGRVTIGTRRTERQIELTPILVNGLPFGSVWRGDRNWFLHVDAEDAGYVINADVYEEAVNEGRRMVAQALAQGDAMRRKSADA